MAHTYGVSVVGYDLNQNAPLLAGRNAARFGVQGLVDFRWCRHSHDILAELGRFDAVFVKSVLYRFTDPTLYGSWLEWAHDRLVPAGALIAVENGRGGDLVQRYRSRFSSQDRASQCFFDDERLADYRRVFPSVHARFFGRISQFLEPLGPLGSAAFRLEERVGLATARKHFVAAVVARPRAHRLGD
jgi:hypothetical protein